MKSAHSYKNYIKYRQVLKAVNIEHVLSAFETNYMADFYFDGEFHSEWEFVYVLSGKVGVSGDDRVYDLKAGDIIFHKPYEFHRLWGIDDSNLNLFIMSFQMNGNLCKKLENGVFSLNEDQKEKLFDLINFLKKRSAYDIDNKLENNNVIYYLDNWSEPTVPQNITNRLEGFLLSLLDEQKSFVVKEDSGDENKFYKRVLSILVEHRFDWISLDEIARLCNISTSQLKKNFALTSKQSIHKYFIKIKIATAMVLLNKGMSVNEVSERLSFSSPNYFCTVFKRETGKTPLKHKKRID